MKKRVKRHVKRRVKRRVKRQVDLLIEELQDAGVTVVRCAVYGLCACACNQACKRRARGV